MIEAIGLEPDRAAADEVDPTTHLTEGVILDLTRVVQVDGT